MHAHHPFVISEMPSSLGTLRWAIQVAAQLKVLTSSLVQTALWHNGILSISSCHIRCCFLSTESDMNNLQNDRATRPKKHKAACDQCNASKVKCPGGGPPCNRCTTRSQPCHYSLARRAGKPPGTRSRKTLERLRQAEEINPERQRFGVKGTLTHVGNDRREDSNQPPIMASQHQDNNVSHNQPESSYVPELWPLSPLIDYPILQSSSQLVPTPGQDFLESFTSTDYSAGEDSTRQSRDPDFPTLERLGTPDLSKAWTTPPDDYDCDVSFCPMTYQRLTSLVPIVQD